jgi:hypothetical protein
MRRDASTRGKVSTEGEESEMGGGLSTRGERAREETSRRGEVSTKERDGRRSTRGEELNNRNKHTTA